MSTNTDQIAIHQSLNKLIFQINAQSKIMDSIVHMSNTDLPEDLEPAAKATWEAEYKVRKHLTEQLARIQSILHSTEQYIFANCG